MGEEGSQEAAFKGISSIGELVQADQAITRVKEKVPERPGVGGSAASPKERGPD